MPVSRSQDPRDAVVHTLMDLGLAGPESRFEPLLGGRTNRLWRFRHSNRHLVCKCYADEGSALFPNSAEKELTALWHLAGSGLAPNFVASAQTDKEQVLVYEYLEGELWRSNIARAANALRQIHLYPPPSHGVPASDHRASSILKTAQRTALETADPTAVMAVQPPLPEDCFETSSVFLHGDPVPANMIDTGNGLVFIDWQCPAIGDAATDIAVFLSPAMQSLYGTRVLESADRDMFLEIYGDPQVVQRYKHLAAILHWRIGVHCVWRAERGAGDYAQAARKEFDFLNTL